MTESDHDLLIRIDTNLVNFNKIFQEHTVQDITQFALLDSKLGAAHKRMDTIAKTFSMMTGAVSLVGLISVIIGIIVGIHQMGWW